MDALEEEVAYLKVSASSIPHHTTTPPHRTLKNLQPGRPAQT